jgi:hypothetical protein
MTVGELLDLLKNHDPDDPLNLAHPDGDLCSDVQLLEVFVYPNDGEPWSLEKAAVALAFGCGHILSEAPGDS